MGKIFKNCPFYNMNEKGQGLIKLEFISALSKNLGNTMISTYVCQGDSEHKAHLIRLEDTNYELELKTFTIPSDMRNRLFPRKEGEWKLHCPLAKAQMIFQKKITDKIGDPSVDIFRCGGTSWGHFSHFAKIQHGRIKMGNFEIGILIFTREVHKKRVRNDDPKLTKGEFIHILNKVWKDDVAKYQLKSIMNLVKKKIS